MKPLVWEDLCVLKRASEEALLEAIEIIRPYVSEGVSDKDIRHFATAWRGSFRRRFSKHHNWSRFLKNEKDWLSSKVRIPAKFLKTYQLPARPGVKFRGASNYCFMCSAMIGEWALPITWRLSKSLCTALKLEITAENLDFETNMVDCLLCSICYEKTVEVNDLVEELEKIQVRMEKVGVEIDAIFARGMENVSLLKPIHGVDSRKFFSPADLRAHIVAYRRRPLYYKNQDRVAKNGKNNTPVPFTITTRKSKALLPEKTDSNEMSSGFRLSPECSDIRIDDTFTLASQNDKIRIDIQNVSQKKERGATNTWNTNSMKRHLPVPLLEIKVAEFFPQRELLSKQSETPAGNPDPETSILSDDFARGIRDSNRSFKTYSREGGLEERDLETPNSPLSESILNVKTAKNPVRLRPNILKPRASVTTVKSVQKATKVPGQHDVIKLPHFSALCTNSYTKTAHPLKRTKKSELPNGKRNFHARKLLLRLLKADAKRAAQLRAKKKMQARKLALTLRRISCLTEGCEFRCDNPIQLNSHILRKHSLDPRPFKCTYPECRKGFVREWSLIRHIQSHLAQTHQPVWTETYCAVCGEFLKSQCSFKTHMEKHEGKVTYKRQCGFPLCSFNATSPEEFKIHARTHHESEKTVPCTQPGCILMFPSEETMEKHKKATHGDKFSCETCGRSFTTRPSRDRHIKLTHVAPGKKDWICERCGQCFAFERYLKRHQHVYPNCLPKALKPGSVYCEICNQPCSSKNSLNRHLQIIHNREEKPWTCRFCNRNFSIKMYLNRHLKESKYCPGSSNYRAIPNSTPIPENQCLTSIVID